MNSTKLLRLTIDDLDYPSRLRELAAPPLEIWTTGDLYGEIAVAIVGSREATTGAAEFAYDLAFDIAVRGGVVVSGGACGVDAAAHRGALAAGGRTWVVAPNGSGRLYPPGHEELFDEVAHSRGAMIWPFPPATPPLRGNFLKRNRVLAALASAVVVPQAARPSGALGAIAQGRVLGRPIWVAVGAPWMHEFEGGRLAAEQGAMVLMSKKQVLAGVGFGAPFRPGPLAAAPLNRPVSSDQAAENKVQRAILELLAAGAQLHRDEIAEGAGLSAAELSPELMMLVLAGKVIDSYDGAFRIRRPTAQDRAREIRQLKITSETL